MLCNSNYINSLSSIDKRNLRAQYILISSFYDSAYTTNYSPRNIKTIFHENALFINYLDRQNELNPTISFRNIKVNDLGGNAVK